MKHLQTIISIILVFISIYFYIGYKEQQKQIKKITKEVYTLKCDNAFKSELLNLYIQESNFSEALLLNEGDSIITINTTTDSIYKLYIKASKQIYVRNINKL